MEEKIPHDETKKYEMKEFTSLVRSKPAQRILFTLVGGALFLISLTMILHQPVSRAQSLSLATTPKCDNTASTNLSTQWRELEEKYKRFPDDKFTVVITTFHRPRELSRVLDSILLEKIPSLQEVVIVWNNKGETPPAGHRSQHGVDVRYRIPVADSLNSKLQPDSAYKTRAVLVSDDDIYFRPSDLEYIFQTWRTTGQNRLVGAMARCSYPDSKGSWDYNWCGSRTPYSMVMTNLAFAHVGFFDLYFSGNDEIKAIRDYVDDKLNCEDIAMNFVAARATGVGPLLARGSQQYVDISPSRGISRKPDHQENRSLCVNHFAKTMGCMPLVETEGRMERGVKHNFWLETFKDRMLS